MKRSVLINVSYIVEIEEESNEEIESALDKITNRVLVQKINTCVKMT